MDVHRTFGLSILAVSLSSSLAVAQATARQGESPVKHFASPMILELPLPKPTGLSPGASRTHETDLQMFACDGVTVSRLQLTFDRRSKRAGRTLVLEIAGTVHVPPSVDRLVHLAFTAKAGDTVVGHAERRKLDAEEDRHTKFKTSIVFDDDGDEQALLEAPEPVLEITVAVADNG